MKKYSTIPAVLLLTASFLFITVSDLQAQITRRVLFLGNSYTGVNNLPQLVHDVALSAGDTLIFDSNTPGGYTLENHASDANSQNKLMTAGWEYIVLQGQSQEPVTHISDFRNGAAQLNTLITQYNPCSVVMLYMTWGRKNGDASYCPAIPVMCTYAGMDSSLRNRYLELAASINTEVSPVSVVWKYLRQNHPGIELYSPDESHPSAAGSYAAACCFYAAVFKKDPTLISYNFGLNATDAAIIRNAAKIQVFDQLSLWDFKEAPRSDFQYYTGSGVNEIIFHAASIGFHETYLWDFGDGTTSSTAYSPHSYASAGTYTVTFTTTNCDLQGSHSSTSDTVIQICNHTPTVYTSHPWLCNHDTLWTQPADSYQWFNYGMPVPETNQYLPYHNYGSYSVLTTLNGCSEMSAPFMGNPFSSGYYFDAASQNDPCEGDTVPFALLHTSGSLPGGEIIQWYKNDTLLPWMTNEDTLLITGGGTYECRVTDPNSSCPSDTTFAVVTFNCDAVGMKNTDRDAAWSIFPNPASESMTVRFTNHIAKDELEIYSAIGSLLKVMQVRGTIHLNIAELPDGLYFIRMKNSDQRPLKFIKQ